MIIKITPLYKILGKYTTKNSAFFIIFCFFFHFFFLKLLKKVGFFGIFPSFRLYKNGNIIEDFSKPYSTYWYGFRDGSAYFWFGMRHSGGGPLSGEIEHAMFFDRGIT